jgi:hypothetical protein
MPSRAASTSAMSVLSRACPLIQRGSIWPVAPELLGGRARHRDASRPRSPFQAAPRGSPSARSAELALGGARGREDVCPSRRVERGQRSFLRPRNVSPTVLDLGESELLLRQIARPSVEQPQPRSGQDVGHLNSRAAQPEQLADCGKLWQRQLPGRDDGAVPDKLVRADDRPRFHKPTLAIRRAEH